MEQAEGSGRYEFVVVPTPFKNTSSQECQENFFKWGMASSMEMIKFWFNKSFNVYNADEFLI